MFENLADYMHVFACDDITGPQLFTALFCARVSAAESFARRGPSLTLPLVHRFASRRASASHRSPRRLRPFAQGRLQACSAAAACTQPMDRRSFGSLQVIIICPFLLLYCSHALHFSIVTSCPRRILMSATRFAGASSSTAAPAMISSSAAATPTAIGISHLLTLLLLRTIRVLTSCSFMPCQNPILARISLEHCPPTFELLIAPFCPSFQILSLLGLA